MLRFQPRRRQVTLLRLLSTTGSLPSNSNTKVREFTRNAAGSGRKKINAVTLRHNNQNATAIWQQQQQQQSTRSRPYVVAIDPRRISTNKRMQSTLVVDAAVLPTKTIHGHLSIDQNDSTTIQANEVVGRNATTSSSSIQPDSAVAPTGSPLHSSSSSHSSSYVDNPCWGSPTECSLMHLLQQIKREECILYESKDFVALNKPPDLRMDGEYPATVHKLLTFWFPPPSVLKEFQEYQNKKKRTEADTGQDQSSQPHRPSDDDDDNNDIIINRDLLFQQFIQTRYHRHSDHPDNQMRPCHQLDYATSGVLLVARTREGANRARIELENRHVQKAYLALVHGNLGTFISKHLNKQNSPTNNQSSSTLLWSTLESMQDIERKWKGMESVHKQQAKQRQRGTFHGFKPAPALFQQWKATQQRQYENNNEEAAAKQDDEEEEVKQPVIKKARHNTKNGSSHHRGQSSKDGGDNRLTAEEWKHVWDQLHSKDDEAFQVRPDMTWKIVKEIGQADRFKNAAAVHNEYMRQHYERAQQQQLDNNNQHPRESGKSTTTGLPLVFGVQAIADKEAAADSVENHDDDDDDILKRPFFICASIADVSHQFSVMLHPQETAELYPPTFLLPPSIEKMEKRKTKQQLGTKEKLTSNKNNNKINEATEKEDVNEKDEPLLFRPCLTQCTILQYNKHNDTTKVLLIPWSGRRHQLRIHMALLGYAIVGDSTYRRRGRRTQCSQMCLHAHRLIVPNLLANDPGQVDNNDGHDDPRKKDNNKTYSSLTLEAPDPFK